MEELGMAGHKAYGVEQPVELELEGLIKKNEYFVGGRGMTGSILTGNMESCRQGAVGRAKDGSQTHPSQQQGLCYFH